MKLKQPLEEVKKTHSKTFLFKAGTSQQQMDSVVWNAFKSGDRSALDFIFQKYVRLLYAYGGKITKDQNLVEDCIQDVFVELWQKRERISEISSVKFYLLKSLRRRLVREISKGKNRPGKDVDTINDNSVEVEFSVEFKMIQAQETHEQREKLFKALSLLSKRQKEAVYLKFYEKVSYEEIAEIMHLGIKSTYNIIGKAIEMLRKNIGS